MGPQNRKAKRQCEHSSGRLAPRPPSRVLLTRATSSFPGRPTTLLAWGSSPLWAAVGYRWLVCVLPSAFPFTMIVFFNVSGLQSPLCKVAADASNVRNQFYRSNTQHSRFLSQTVATILFCTDIQLFQSYVSRRCSFPTATHLGFGTFYKDQLSMYLWMYFWTWLGSIALLGS